MTRRLRWVLLGLPLALAALAGLAWLALDTWLESAGGRRAIEDVLSAQSGYPVSLAGEFEVVLLPVPGVSGTDLRVGGAPGEDVFATSARYGVSLDLRALLRREVNVNRLTLGDVRFGATDGLLVPEIEITGFAMGFPIAKVRGREFVLDFVTAPDGERYYHAPAGAYARAVSGE